MSRYMPVIACSYYIYCYIMYLGVNCVIVECFVGKLNVVEAQVEC